MSIAQPANGNLPEGWTQIALNSVASQIQYGYTASAQKNDAGPKFLRITDIQNGKVHWESVPTCSIVKDDLRKYALQAGDIVFARTGATTGKSFLIRSSPRDAVFASYLIRLRLNEGVDPAFVNLFFNTPAYWEYISENVAGNAQPNCNASKLGLLEIPVAPLAEQKRIVGAAQRSLARVAAARKRLAQVPDILKRFRQAVLATACSGRLTADWRTHGKMSTTPEELFQLAQTIRRQRYEQKCARARQQGDRRPNDPRNAPRSNKPVIELPEIPEEWGLYPLQDLCHLITDGTHRTPKYLPQGITFLSVKNVRPFRVLDGDVKRISIDEHREINSRCNPEAGDILYTKIGTFGLATINNLKYPFSLFVSVALLKPVKEVFTGEYAEVALNSEFVYSQARDRVSGSGTPDLHLIEIRDFRIPLPTIEEQKEIVRRVKVLMALADAIEKRVAAASARTEKLTQAILAKAFRGELVPTEAALARREGRSYESAAELLARIAKEQQQPGLPNLPRKRKRHVHAIGS